MAEKGNTGPGVGVEAIGVGVATVITSVIISKLAGKMADVVVGDSSQDSAEMYDRLHGNVAKSSFRISPSPRLGGSQVTPRRMPSHRAAPVNSHLTMKYIEGAIEQLEEAKGTTRCGICLKKIDGAIKAVKEEAKVIETSELKYQILQRLKDAGKIPRNVMWHQLSPKQKVFVEKMVKKEVKT